MNPHYRHRHIFLITALAGFFVVGGWVIAPRVLASPISGTTTPAGATIYQGLLSIATTDGQNLMEIGANGQDIASTGDIYLRPEQAPAFDGSRLKAIRLTKNGAGTAADLYIPGGLCLYGYCRDTWPTEQIGQNWVYGAGNYLIENPSLIPPPEGIFFSQPVSTAPALSLVAQGTALSLTNYSTDFTAQDGLFASSVFVRGTLLVKNIAPVDRPNQEIIYGIEGGDTYHVWHAWNDGKNSGLDAAKLDGVNFRITKDYLGSDFPDCQGANTYCLCGRFEDPGNNFVYRCTKL